MRRRIEEEPDEQARASDEDRRDGRAADHGRRQRDLRSLDHPFADACTEVVADDRLRRLCDSVADHEDERNIITGDAERPDAVVAKIVHESQVADEHQHRQRRLAQQGRRTDAALITDVAQRQAQALAAAFERTETQRACEKRQVDDHDHTAHRDTDRRGERRTHDAPAQRKDEEPVQHHIEQRGDDAAPHGQLRGSVQPDDEQPDGRPHLEDQRRCEPEQVVLHQRQQPVGRTEQAGRPIRKNHDQQRKEQRQRRHDNHGLCDVQAGRLDLRPRQMNGGDDRTTDADHQPHPLEKHQQRDVDVHGGDAVAADAVADENPVGHRDSRDAEHTEQRRNEQFAEQYGHFQRSEVDLISFHTYFILR